MKEGESVAGFAASGAHLPEKRTVAVAERDVWKGVVVGAVSGLMASWMMLQFIDGPGSRWLEAGKTDADREAERQRQERNGPDTPESVTMQAADVFASHAPGGRHLSLAERKTGGTLVHYGFGAAMGAAYGAAAEIAPMVGVGLGVPFATVLWASTDLVAVPAVGFAKWPTDEPAPAHGTHWLAHMIFGVGMETVRRLGRWMW